MFDNEQHEKLFGEVVDFLKSHSWEVCHLGIEQVPDLPDAVLFGESIMIRELRGRCDAVAYHQPTGSFFIFDVKRPTSTKYLSASVEVLPLCQHIRNQDRCIYIVEHTHHALDFAFGFECQQAVMMVQKFFIPVRYYRGGDVDAWVSRSNGSAHDTVAEYRTRIEKTFPSVKFDPNVIVEIDSVSRKFSGDPFVLLSPERTQKLPHWREVLKARMDQCEADGQHVLDRRVL